MRTANPALNDKIFADARESGISRENRMTVQGTVNKTGLMLVLLLIPAFYVWGQVFKGAETGELPPTIGMYIWGGLIGGLVLALITIFARKWAAFTAPLYAVCEGFFLGGISAFFEMQFPGIVLQAVALTFGTLFGLLLAYTSGLIKVTDNFRLGVVAATGGIFFVYLISIVLGMFGVGVPFIHDSGPIGIGFSVFVVIIAALNLVLDFDFIESGAEQGAPKYMEWYAAFGLMVTLVWLYLEILRLLAKLQSRR